jgi:hypothetical protein
MCAIIYVDRGKNRNFVYCRIWLSSDVAPSGVAIGVDRGVQSTPVFGQTTSLKVADVKSLPCLVAHMYKNQLHESYNEIYHLACILITIPVSSASCERAFSKLKLVKK